MKVGRETIFNYVKGSRFVAITRLPDPVEPLVGYQVINIQAEKGMSPEKLSNTLIYAFGEKPKFGGGELRARQLKSLMEAHSENGDQLIFSIQDAHLLPPRTLWSMKPLSEMFDNFREKTKIGFIFLGDVAVLSDKISKMEDIELRTDFICQ
jgi:hypothetical protein